MIVSNPKGLLFDLGKRINRRRLRRSFAALRARDWHNLLNLPSGASLLVMSNHHTWWDEMLLLELFALVLDYDSYWMSDISRLKKHPGLTRIGVFSIAPDNAEESRRSVRHMADLLEGTQRMVGFFPQIQPGGNGAALAFQNPAGELLSRQKFAEHVYVVKVAATCGFWADPRPEWFVQIGRPQPVSDLPRDGNDSFAGWTASLTSLFDELRVAVRRGRPEDFTLLWKGITWFNQ